MQEKMELNNFDQNIKNKLEERTIEPSAKSWDRLDAMLSVETKPKKKSFVWYYVAASLFLVFGVSYWFVNQNSNEVVPQNTIVKTDENSIQIEESENTIEIQNGKNDLIKEVKSNKSQFLVQHKKENQSKVNLKNETITEVLNLENPPIDQPTTDNRQQITNKFISPEKLLAAVQNDENETSITAPQTNLNKIKVDPNSLLSSVENEITEEYRETTFDKLKRKYNETKTAVVNRNYE